MNKFDAIIIGGGPAGLTAGLYCARYGLKTIIVEKGLVGGTAVWANSIQNYPGYLNTTGFELMNNFREQVEKAGVVIENDTVQKISDIELKEKKVILSNKELVSKVIIVAVGAKSKWLNVKGEKDFLNKGIHFCATCDGPLYKDKKVCVIGSDNRAAEEAIYLASVTSELFLLSPKKELAIDDAKLSVLREKKVVIKTGVTIKEFFGDTMLGGVVIRNEAGVEESIEIKGAFVLVGTEPNTEFISARKDEEGKLIVNQKMETDLVGVFACGDCIKKELNQIATCVGEGAIAAHSASKFVQNKNF